MIKPKLRRSIYIGIGGTGIKAIKMVKQNFLENSTSQTLPKMIKVLCVDTNNGDLNKVEQGTNAVALDEMEKLHLTVGDPLGTYNAFPEMFKKWLPEINYDSIKSISGIGAGQARSNGRFILDVTEKIGTGASFFSERLKSIYADLTSATLEDLDYDLLPTQKIDVHLIFSIAGGTGSGMFLRIAQIIKQTIPNVNLIGYAFSHAFYTNVGVNWNITHNSYGALVELDYCMHADRKEYESVSHDLRNKLFDAVMYIDDKTYTWHQTQPAYQYKIEEVLVNVGYALYLSAGEIGANAASIVDNLRVAMNSKGYDYRCRNGKKSAWVSSVGVSELFCKPNADEDYDIIKNAIFALRHFVNGDENTSLSVDSSNEWINKLHLNERNDENDHNELINKLLEPELYKNPGSTATITIHNDGSVVNDDKFISINDDKIGKPGRKSIQATLIDEIKRTIISYVIDYLFPEQGGRTKGLTYVKDVIFKFRGALNESNEQLNREIVDLKAQVEECNSKIEEGQNSLQTESGKGWRKDNALIANYKRKIVDQCKNRYKLNCEIFRRELANGVYKELVDFVNSYIDEESGTIVRLITNVTKACKDLENQSSKQFGTKSLTAKSTAIDLTEYVPKLPNSIVNEKVPIDNWKDFFSKTGYGTITDLANKKDWGEYIKDYFQKAHPVSTAPLIIRVLNHLSPEELKSKITDVVNRARPLMDITSYGETIKASDFIFVSIPANIDKTSDLPLLQNIFKQVYQGTTNIEYIPSRDTNKVLVYRQMGVIPAYYISGISSGKNGNIVFDSCEKKYRDFLESGNVNYSPFTDKFFEQAFREKEHSLDSVMVDDSPFMLWIKCFIFKLIERNDGMYRIEHSLGEMDLLDAPSYRSWVNLGITRDVAFNDFISRCQNATFADEINNKIGVLLQDEDNKAELSKYCIRDSSKNALYMKNSLYSPQLDGTSRIVMDLLKREVGSLSKLNQDE